MALIERYAVDDLVAALQRALRYRAYDARVVRRILETTAEPRVLPDAGREASLQRLREVLEAPAPRAMGEYAEALRDD